MLPPELLLDPDPTLPGPPQAQAHCQPIGPQMSKGEQPGPQGGQLLGPHAKELVLPPELLLALVVVLVTLDVVPPLQPQIHWPLRHCSSAVVRGGQAGHGIGGPQLALLVPPPLLPVPIEPELLVELPEPRAQAHCQLPLRHSSAGA